MTGPAAPPPTRLLTVLRLVAHGYGQREIATQLGIPVETVKSRMTALRKACRVHQATELVMLACRHGWLPEYQPNAKPVLARSSPGELRGFVVADPAAIVAARRCLQSLHTVRTVELLDLSSKDRSP